MGALIGLDWGTSSLRAYLFGANGSVLDARHRPYGIRSLPGGGFDAALAEIVQGWPRCPRLAAGMVGARGGWREVPYVELPLEADAIGASLHSLMAADGEPVHLVPGLRNPRRPDVMRGEETQILGALALHPALGGHATLAMPGTHSKWVSLRGARIVDFQTLMTGELFAVLTEHSILGAPLKGEGALGAAQAEAFDRGVRLALDSGGAGGISRLFSIRASMLSAALAVEDIADTLSGLLIGEEARSVVADGAFDLSAPVHLIGEEALCARYCRALQAFSIEARVIAQDVAAHGLWRIGTAAGLVAARAAGPGARA